jgi:TonB family protein
MRRLSSIFATLSFVIPSLLTGQTTPSQAPPQTARQALIEMFFSDAPGHFEKHLPDITRQTFQRLKESNGQSTPEMFSLLASQAKAGGAKFETFDAGTTLLRIKGPSVGAYDKTEITVERDDLLGDEDQIELALHTFKGGKEEALFATILRFTFTMKLEAEVWRLNEASARVRFPLADPAFLKSLEENQFRQNEQMALWSVRSINTAEKSYHAAQGGFACSLSGLTETSKDGGPIHAYLYDAQLASGKKNGYVFKFSDCNPAHYSLVAEPAAPDSGQRAYCSDESGSIRSSADGKAASCVANGEVVEDKLSGVTEIAPPHGSSSSTLSASPGRVRVSSGVAAGLLITKVPPVYRSSAKSARIQGTVLLKAVIDQSGNVASTQLISGHPMLAPAAIEAVKQWKYRPYLLNGKPVEVETQLSVNFALSE